MELGTDLLLAEIRRLNEQLQTLSARNSLLEYLLQTAPQLPDRHDSYPGLPTLDLDGKAASWNLPVLTRDGKDALQGLPTPNQRWSTLAGILPVPDPDGKLSGQMAPSPNQDGHQPEVMRPIPPPQAPFAGAPSGALAVLPVRAVTPAAPPLPLPGYAALVRVLKKNGMTDTKNEGVIRAARLLLLVAAGTGPVLRRRICTELGLTPGGATKLLASLRRRGWLLRLGHYGLKLTPEAVRLLALACEQER